MADVTLMGASYSDVPAVELPRTGGGTARFYDPNEILYAASPTSGGPATYANGIHYGAVDGTSTSTQFTATIPGITSLYDGLTIMLYNGVVTSASGFTININNLGAYGAYNNMTMGNAVTPTNPTRDTTLFNINYAMLFVFCSDIGGLGTTSGWICYRGYDANTNTIGYQLRTNSYILKTADKTRYYRLLFQSADNTHWIPANTGTDNSATSAKTINQRKINPFGAIVYCGATTSFAAEADISATVIWEQYAFNLGYSFSAGSALTMTTKTPVYIKCAPQSDGSAIIDSTTPFVQALPSTADGKIYIYLGIAYSATNVELTPLHPVYEYKDGAIRLYTAAPAASGGVTSVNGQTGAVTIPVLPTVSSADNGKVLRVVSGAWAAVDLPSASGVSF